LLVMMYTQGCFMPEIVGAGCGFENQPNGLNFEKDIQ
jgi:hypothetical protein